MAGTINSLGIGSGVLTADVIDKLKANDISNIITPIDKKITLNQQKTQALDLLNSLLTSFKGNVNSLSDDVLYQKRTVAGNNDGINITALSGTAIQSFSISNVQLAMKDVVQSGSFTSPTTSILQNPSSLAADFQGTLKVTLDSKDDASTNIPKDFNISYNKNTTLEELKTAINDVAGSSVTASILQTGNSAYNLIITSKETGETQAITLSDTSGELVSQLTTSVKTIQDARDASFNYNGIPIVRSSNSIDDLVDNVTKSVTINLLQDNANANISIKQDKQIIADELKNLTTAYNTLMKQLDDMTLSDLENGKIGIFNGDNSIKSIKREITKMITSVNSNGQSLAQYGIGLSEKGAMTFNQSDFNTKMDASPIDLEAFFSGKTTIKSIGTTTTATFSDPSSLISSGIDGTLKIQVGSNSYSFNYTATTTLQQIVDTINSDASISSKLTAKIVQYGTNDYRMVLTPKNQSIGEIISISDVVGGGLLSAFKNTVSTPTVTDTTYGIFGDLDSLINSYNKSNGFMNTLTQASKNELKSLNNSKTNSQALLNARYEAMSARFAQYDAMISKLNSQFSSLRQQIDAMAKANS